MSCRAVALVVMLSSCAHTLLAQGPRLAFAPSTETPSLEGPADSAPIPARCRSVEPALVGLGGLVGGAVGMIGGAYLLAAISDGRGEDDDLAAAVVGGTLGEVIGVAVGAHLAGGSRGNAVATFVASGLGFIAGAVLASRTADPYQWVMVPLVQIPVTAMAEHASARAIAAREPACHPI